MTNNVCYYYKNFLSVQNGGKVVRLTCLTCLCSYGPGGKFNNIIIGDKQETELGDQHKSLIVAS